MSGGQEEHGSGLSMKGKESILILPEISLAGGCPSWLLCQLTIGNRTAHPRLQNALCLPRSGTGICLENGLAHPGCPALPNSSLQLLELVEERMVGSRGLPCGSRHTHTHTHSQPESWLKSHDVSEVSMPGFESISFLESCVPVTHSILK